MKQINFNHEGGFPLEQETLERLQTAYRSELFGALKAHLSIDTNQNYIVAPATNATIGWVIIQQDESNLKDPETALPITEGILYPVNKGDNTGYLKTTRTGTNLIYGTGISRTAYFDYEADYVSQSEFVNGISQDSDALKINYYDLAQFKIVKDLKAIEGILEAINVKIGAIESNIDTIESNIDSVETAINVINQTYLPLDGSKAMTGDLSMSSKKLLQPTNSTGRALVNSSDAIISSISLNYQSDWQNTIIGGKVHLNNLNTSDSTGSLLVIDGSHQVTKSNSLPELLNRITVLESKISAVTAAVPIGMIAMWGKPAPFPEGWEEYVPLRGRMPVGLDINDSSFNTLLGSGGSKYKTLTINEIPSHTHTETRLKPGSGSVVNFEAVGDDGHLGYDSVASGAEGGGQQFSILNPYRIIQFIEYTGRPGDSTAPTKPNLTFSNIGNSTLTLNWTASTDDFGVTSYEVYRNSVFLGSVSANVFSYTVFGLSPGTNYSFYVIAKDAAGNFSTSDTENTTTLAMDSIKPTTPTDLVTYPDGDSHITIQWTPSTDNVAVVRYEVWRRTSGGISAVYLGTPDNYCTVFGSPNITYYFKVKALDAAGNESLFSVEVAGAVEPVNSCFDVESLVTMASGQSKKLKNIVVGDKLQGLTFPNEIDESEGDYMLWSGKLNEADKAEVTVVNKRTSLQPNYYEIKTADTTIRATGQHPLLVTEDGKNVEWVCIKNLIQSMLLIDKTGKTKVIESIVFKEEPLEVALLDVENVDNYVISGIVAHNNKPEDPHDPQP